MNNKKHESFLLYGTDTVRTRFTYLFRNKLLQWSTNVECWCAHFVLRSRFLPMLCWCTSLWSQLSGHSYKSATTPPNLFRPFVEQESGTASTANSHSIQQHNTVVTKHFCTFTNWKYKHQIRESYSLTVTHSNETCPDIYVVSSNRKRDLCLVYAK